MGYFPNGTSSIDYQERYCVRCVHGQDKEYGPVACPVMWLHFEHNYEDAWKDMLNELIPREGICNLECKMFVPTSTPPVSAQ